MLAACVVYSRPYDLDIKVQEKDGKFGLLVTKGPRYGFNVVQTFLHTIESKEELLRQFGEALRGSLAMLSGGEPGPFTPLNEHIIERILKDLEDTDEARTYEYSKILTREEERMVGEY